MNTIKTMVLASIVLFFSVAKSSQNITIKNETDTTLYVATAYYRPFLKRIDTELPVTAIQEIGKQNQISLLLPIKRGWLKNDRILIFSPEKQKLSFMETIYDTQQQSQVNQPERLNQLKELEKISEAKMESIARKTLSDQEKVYTITPSDLLINEHRPTASSTNQSELIITPKINAPTKEAKNNEGEEIKNRTNVAHVIEKKAAEAIPEPSRKEPKSLPTKLTKSILKKEQPSKVVPQKNISQAVWTTLGKLGRKESYIINGTEKNLYIKTQYAGQKDSSIITIEPNNTEKIKNLDVSIRYGQWRYLLYSTNTNKEDWKKIWMWPASDVYVIDLHERVHEYNYAARGVLVTKDVSIDKPIYVAMYQFNKGWGALRTTPVIEISQPEKPLEMYHTTYTPFGHRQLAVANTKDALAASLNDTAYGSLVKQELSLGIGQKYAYLAEINDTIQIYDQTAWKSMMHKLSEPSEPVKLDWIETFLLSKFQKGAEFIKNTLQ